jgi:hypothetical protein
MKEPLDQGQYDILETIERRMAAQGDPLERMANSLVKAQFVAQTQAAILKYAEPMAQVLAEAAMASQKATGDLPEAAGHKWLMLIWNRTLELIREKRAQAEQKQIGVHPGEAPKGEDQKAP